MVVAYGNGTERGAVWCGTVFSQTSRTQHNTVTILRGWNEGRNRGETGNSSVSPGALVSTGGGFVFLRLLAPREGLFGCVNPCFFAKSPSDVVRPSSPRTAARVDKRFTNAVSNSAPWRSGFYDKFRSVSECRCHRPHRSPLQP